MIFSHTTAALWQGADNSVMIIRPGRGHIIHLTTMTTDDI